MGIRHLRREPPGLAAYFRLFAPPFLTRRMDLRVGSVPRTLLMIGASYGSIVRETEHFIPGFRSRIRTKKVTK